MKRIMSKPLPKRLFWSFYYFAGDRMKLLDQGFTAKIIGSNYFVLLKSNSR